MRKAVGTLVVAALFIFGANVVIKYAVQKMDFKALPSIESPFARPAFLALAGNYHIVYTDCSIKMAEASVDQLQLPVISGITLQEIQAKGADSKKRRLFKKLLKIPKKDFAQISEISIRNPENVVLVTVEGQQVLAGDSLESEKLKDLNAALEEAGKLGKRFTTADIRFDKRIILK